MQQHENTWVRAVWGVLVLSLVGAGGCVQVPHQRVTVDRMEYGQVIADSWKRQTLLNVVRLRYLDAPVFLEVGSIINSYSVVAKGTLGATNLSAPGLDSVTVGGEGSWSNTPTVTYQPVLGDRFTRSLLQPVPPVAVFQLLQGGWPANLVLPTIVRSINGYRNAAGGVVADPEFTELVEIFSRIQRTSGLAIRIDQRADGTTVIITMPRSDKNREFQSDRRRVGELLGLTEGINEIEVTYGLIPRKNNEVAILSRSMLELMLELGNDINLPAAHMDQGRAIRRNAKGNVQTNSLLTIRSGTQEPADSYAAVNYKGYWYWIDDNDIYSKRTFTFLLILFSLAETGQASLAPVVTVPSR